MAGVIRDDIDFSAYEQATEASVKVRKASDFGAELMAEFAPRDRSRVTEMFSTKLRGLIDFRPGEVTVWAGYNGHKKSMFTGQLVLDFMVQKRRTLVASMEMLPSKTLARMACQAFASQTLTQDEAKRFAAWSDGRLWMFDHVGRVSPRIMLAVLRYFAEELKGTQVVIDSMMMVCASEESLDEQKQFITDLVRVAQETELHVHLVAHCRKPASGDERPPTKYDIKGSGSITDQSHNVCLVYANRAKKAALERDPNDIKAGKEPDQLIIVDKQRNGTFEGKVAVWFDEPSLRFCDDRGSPVLPYAMREAA